MQVTISEDQESIVKSVKRFAERFNTLVETANKYDKYDQETKQRGVLLGDPTLGAVQRSIYTKVNQRDTDLTGRYKSLAEIGITIGDGGKLSLDEGKLTEALNTDADAVKTLFTLKETQDDEVTGKTQITKAGIGVEIEELLKRLTDADTGNIQGRIDSINDQIALNKDRIDQMNEQLQAKRDQLRAKFTAMEQSIAGLQRQSQSLSGLRSAGGASSSLQQLSSLG